MVACVAISDQLLSESCYEVEAYRNDQSHNVWIGKVGAKLSSEYRQIVIAVLPHPITILFKLVEFG
jgi:hypothetical protein